MHSQSVFGTLLLTVASFWMMAASPGAPPQPPSLSASGAPLSGSGAPGQLYFSTTVPPTVYQNQAGTWVPLLTGTLPTLPSIPPPAAPIAASAVTVTAGTITSSSIQINWNVPATGTPPFTYLVEKSADGILAWAPLAAAQTLTTYTLTGVAPATADYFRVTPSNAAGPGPTSAVLMASTTAAGSNSYLLAAGGGHLLLAGGGKIIIQSGAPTHSYLLANGGGHLLLTGGGRIIIQ